MATEGHEDGNDCKPISIVLLLRKNHSLQENQILAAARRAFSTETKRLEVTVRADGDTAVVIAGPNMLSLLSVGRPYLDQNPTEWAKSLPHPVQQKAWAEHRAWIAVDYVADAQIANSAYAVLAQLAAEMLDANCCGVFLPGESVFIPYDERLGESLDSLFEDP